MRIGPWQLADGYDLLPFDGQDDVGPQDVMAFWEREGVLTPQERQERVHELLLVARHEDGAIAGVSTAYLDRVPRLGVTLWHLRALVGREHRNSAIGYWLGVRSREVLSERWSDGSDTRAPGLLFELENTDVARAFPMAVWPTMQFTFVGRNAAGQDLRLHWFPRALAPEPPR